MTTILSVPGMHCAHCAAAIRTAIAPIADVIVADIDLNTKTVTLEHSTALSLEAIHLAIEEAGFDIA